MPDHGGNKLSSLHSIWTLSLGMGRREYETWYTRVGAHEYLAQIEMAPAVRGLGVSII